VPFWAASNGDGRWFADRAVVGPHERLSWPRAVGFGLQHLLAMAAAALLVPAVTGLSVSTTLLFSGIGTLLFLLLTRRRLPAYLGSSFAFVAPLQAASDTGLAAQLGGVLLAGLVLTAVAVAVKALGPRVVELLMPPVVTGAVVMLFGLSLARGAAGWVAAQPVVAVLTMLAVAAAAMLLGGDAGRLAALIGLLAGWVAAALLGGLDPARVEELAAASWIGVPQLTSPRIAPAVALATLPVVIVLMAENIGGLKAIGAVTGRPVDRLAGDTLVAVGLGTTLAGLGGGSGASIRPENVGVLAVSRVYSSAAVVVAALAAIVLSTSPKMTALLLTVPLGVLGGAGIVLFGLLGIAGFKVWVNNRVQLSDPLTLLVGSVTLIAGIGTLTVTIGEVPLGGLTWGSIAIVLLYLLLRTVRRVAAERGASASARRQRGTDPGWQVGQK
jgi:uracil-xanthine permease